MPSLAAYEADIVEAVRRRVHARLSTAVAAGATVGDFGDPEQVAEAMAAALPAAHPFDSVVGPFYDTGGLVSWLGITRQALHHRAKVGQLLACPTADGHTVYPAWQFTPDGSTIPYLAEVLAALRAGSDDPWTHAIWLRTSATDLGNRSAADWLAAGRKPDRVLAAARGDAARWAA